MMRMLPAILNQQGATGGFDPLSLSWHTVMWAEDPAESPTDGDLLTSWNNPGTSTPNWTGRNASNRGKWNSTVALFGNQPAITGETSAAWMQALSIGTVTTPCTLVAIAAETGGAKSILGNASGASGIEKHTSAWAVRRTTFRTYGANDAAAHLHVAEFDTTYATWVDGTSYSPGANTPGDFTNLYSGTGLEAHYALLGIVAGLLTAGEKADLLSWSRTHYGTP